MSTPGGVVASGHPRVTAAAIDVLRSGGNAFDASVAAAFAAAVAEPMLTSLGGGGFLLAHRAGGDTRVYDFFVDVPGRGLAGVPPKPHIEPVVVRFPSSSQTFHVGAGSVAVPGTLRGLLHVHAELCSLPLAVLLAPAVALAREGVALTAHQAYVLGLLIPITTASAAGRAVYAPKGRPLQAGERMVNTQLAAFLERLPTDGDRAFYDGALAREVAAAVAAGGGQLTAADLGAYRVVERSPLAVEYRGSRLLTNPAPSFGGSLIALSLELLASSDVSASSWGSATHLGWLVAVMHEVERGREAGAGGASAELHERLRRLRVATGGTTHISVRDAAGNAASMSLSNGEGSGWFVPETGIMLNNMMGEDDLHPEGAASGVPGERVASMMSPSLVMAGDTSVLVAGSGGSKRIRTAMLQVISNVVDFGLPLREAIERPRLHWDGQCVQLEPGFPRDAVRALARRWPVNEWSEPNLYFGGVHAVTPTEGAGDPRRGGAAGSIR